MNDYPPVSVLWMLPFTIGVFSGVIAIINCPCGEYDCSWCKISAIISGVSLLVMLLCCILVGIYNLPRNVNLSDSKTTP